MCIRDRVGGVVTGGAVVGCGVVGGEVAGDAVAGGAVLGDVVTEEAEGVEEQATKPIDTAASKPRILHFTMSRLPAPLSDPHNVAILTGINANANVAGSPSLT